MPVFLIYKGGILSKNVMCLYGKNSVFERIKANPASIKKIFVSENFSEPVIQAAIKAANIPLECFSKHELSKIKNISNHQGIIAYVSPFVYAFYEDLINEKEHKRCILFLDRVYDPHNLGAIIRTAACFGTFAIVIPKHKACEVTEAVLHVASGGENYVPISLVPNLLNAITKAKKSGYWIIGAVPEEGDDITKVDIPFPLGIVLGSEGEGIRYGIDKHLDIKVRIPMKGVPLSLNVTVACAIICHEVSKNKL